nr:breast carcinoma-amplified sequence 4 isoform X1 [Vulpes vulpes]
MKVPEFKIATRYYFYSSRKDVFLHSRLFCCGSDGSCRKQQALALSKHLSRDKWVKRGAFRCRAAGTGPAQKRLVSPPWSRTVWPGAKEVEETIEGMLLRLEEFCSLTDMIRSDTSQILEENIPLLQAKVTEMRGIYARVDQLEAFVKMVGHHVSLLEAQVLQAERDHGAFSRALRRWLGSTGLPSFGNHRSLEIHPSCHVTQEFVWMRLQVGPPSKVRVWGLRAGGVQHGVSGFSPEAE